MTQSEADALALKIARALNAAETTAPVWNLVVEDAGVGRARCSMRVGADMLNGHGTAHGGMIFALADTAFAYACNSRNVRSFAQAASISFLSPARAGEILTATAREDGAGGRASAYTVTVAGEDGRTVAVFHGLARTAGGPVVD
jgi:acyl-CoA thioesterase